MLVRYDLTRRAITRIVCLLLLTALCPGRVFASDSMLSDPPATTDTPPIAPRKIVRESINLEATDPLATFRQIQFRSYSNLSRWQTETTTNDYEFRSVYPFEAWNRPNILRIILPFSSEPEGSAALKDIEIVDVALYKKEWGGGCGTGIHHCYQLAKRSK